jgi:hypothetical protein
MVHKRTDKKRELIDTGKDKRALFDATTMGASRRFPMSADHYLKMCASTRRLLSRQVKVIVEIRKENRTREHCRRAAERKAIR